MNYKTILDYKTNLFKILFVLYCNISLLFTWTEYQNLFTFLISGYYLVQIVIIPILVIMFWISSPNISEIVCFILCVGVGILVALKIRDPRYLMFILFFFGSKDIDYISVFKCNVKFNIFIFLVTIFSSIVHIIPDITLERDAGVYRQSLGFSAPNLLILFFMIIVLQVIIIKRNNLKITTILIIFILTILFGKLTDGRGGLIGILFTLLSALLINKIKIEHLNTFFHKRLIKVFFVLLPEILSLVMLILIIKVPYDSNLYNLLNKLFSFRFDISHFYFFNLGIHLLPEKPSIIYNYPWSSVFQVAIAPTIDNLYMFLFCFIGIVGMIVYLSIYSFLINNAIRNGDYWLLSCLIAFLLVGFVESQMVSPFVGIFAISFSNSNRLKMKNFRINN